MIIAAVGIKVSGFTKKRYEEEIKVEQYPGQPD